MATVESQNYADNFLKLEKAVAALRQPDNTDIDSVLGYVTQAISAHAAIKIQLDNLKRFLDDEPTLKTVVTSEG